MKKVLHIITGLADGGAEATLFRLCTNDPTAEHIVVSLMGPGKYGELLVEAGVEVHCLSMKRGRFEVRGLLKLRKLIHGVNPTVIQTWMYHAALVGSIAAGVQRRRNIVWGIHHSVLSREFTSRGTLLVVRALQLMSHYIPRRIVYCAEAAKLVHESKGFASSKGVTIPNGYDFEKFSPSLEKHARIRGELGINEDSLVFGTVARWHPDKDHRTLFEALRFLKSQIKGFEVLLVGADLTPLNKECVGLLHEAGLKDHVHLLGRRDDIDEVMAAIDFNVLSSSSEAFPNVLVEAMACGTPCISTDVGDATTIIGETGWIVAPGDSQGLGARLLEAAESRGSREDLARRASARERVIGKYSLHKMVDEYHTSAW